MEEYCFHNQEVYESLLADIGFAWEEARQDQEPNQYLRFAGLVKFYLGTFWEHDVNQQIKHAVDFDYNRNF